MKKPSPLFQTALASSLALMLPEHIGNDIAANPIGSGAFKLARYQAGIGLTYEKNENYFKPGLPYLDGVRLILIPDPTTALAAFRTGELEWTSAAGALILPSNIDNVRNDVAGLQLLTYTGAIFTLFLNTKAPFDNPDVRRALHLAIDRDEYVAVSLQGVGNPYVVDLPSTGRFGVPEESLRGAPGWRSPKEADLEEARMLLERAGFSSSNPLRIEILVPNLPSLTEATTLVAGQWGRIGVDTTINALDRAASTQLRDNGNFEVYAELLAHFLDDPAVVYPTHYMPGGTGNWAKYDLADVNRLYEESSALDDEGRRAKVVELQMRTIENNWWIPVGESQITHGVQGYVRNMPTQSFGFFSNRYRYEEVWLDQ